MTTKERKDIYFIWDIHYKCNFRCPYCWFYKNWDQMEKKNVYLSPKEWFECWQKVYKKYGPVRIEITGGEPFLYPDFIDLIKLLTNLHKVKITTNMSGDIERFAREIDPEKVNLDMNFHILFSELESYIEKVLILKRAGFKGGVCYLAYPPQMEQIEYLNQRFTRAGISFALAAFWGEYNGKQYPQAYSENERQILRPFLGDADRVTYHLNAESPKGKLCNAGYNHAVIHANGDVIRCAPLEKQKIGNIISNDFRLFDLPAACQADFCPCNEYENLV